MKALLLAVLLLRFPRRVHRGFRLHRLLYLLLCFLERLLLLSPRLRLALLVRVLLLVDVLYASPSLPSLTANAVRQLHAHQCLARRLLSTHDRRGTDRARALQTGRQALHSLPPRDELGGLRLCLTHETVLGGTALLLRHVLQLQATVLLVLQHLLRRALNLQIMERNSTYNALRHIVDIVLVHLSTRNATINCLREPNLHSAVSSSMNF